MHEIQKSKIQTWFVTGASSGVGYEMCKQLLSRGYNVVAVSRRVPDFEHKNALCLSADVTDPISIGKAIKSGIAKFGRIDVLANNAGISANVTLEEETLEHMQEVMNTNFWGVYNTMHALLPHFRANGNGTIINNSSQSGISCRKFGSAYVSSKHAIEGLSGVCWHEAQKFCRVMVVELGYFKETGIYKTSLSQKTEIEEYKKIPIFYKKFSRDFVNDLKVAVSCILDAAECKHLPRRLMLGKDALIQIGTEIDWLLKDFDNSMGRALLCSGCHKPIFFTRVKRNIWRLFFKSESF